MKKSIKLTAFVLVMTLLCSSLYLMPYAAQIVSGDFVFSQTGDTLTLTNYKGRGGVVEVPSKVGGKTVTEIGVQAFAEYYNETPDETRITKVILPSTVTKVSKNAFLECTKLETVEMIGVRSLGEAAFWYCKGLKRVAVSASLREIGQNAFGKCGDVKIYTEKGSLAEEYAKSNGIKSSRLYPDKIAFTKSSTDVTKGKSLTLKVKLTPSDVYFKDLYFTSGSDNAVVTQSGKVTGKKLGTARVSCMAIFGGAVTECVVTVRTPAPKSFTASSVGFDSMVLSWSKATSAQGYRIEMKKGGKWTKLCDTKELSYKVTGLSASSSYDFRVRAYCTQNKVKYYSSPVLLTQKTLTLAKVKNVKANSYSAKGHSFSWDKVKNASGYQIYALGSKGKYEKLAETKDLVFSNTLSSGTIKTYKIRAFRNVSGKKVYGAFTSPFTFASKPSEVTGLKISSKTKNSLTLKWNGVKNASSYAVYNLSGGKYSLVAKTTAKTLEIESLKPETKYTYVVKAYISTTLKTVSSNYSASVSGTTSPAVSAEQKAADDITKAIIKASQSSDFYAVSEKKTTVLVKSCTGSYKAQKLADAFASYYTTDESAAYEFINGVDSSSMTPQALLIPSQGFVIKASDVKSAVREKDGSGTRITLTMKSEKVSGNSAPAINSHIWGMIDTEEIKNTVGEDAGITSVSVTYSGTVLSAKINSDGTFDTMTITVPFTVKTISVVNGEQVETVMSGRTVRDYTLTWW